MMVPDRVARACQSKELNLKCDQCGVENGQHAATCKLYGMYNFPASDHPAPPSGDRKNCPECQASNLATAKFCVKCGMSFREPARRPQSTSSTSGSRAAALTMTSGTTVHVSGARVSTSTTVRPERPAMRAGEHAVEAVSGAHRRRAGRACPLLLPLPRAFRRPTRRTRVVATPMS